MNLIIFILYIGNELDKIENFFSLLYHNSKNRFLKQKSIYRKASIYRIVNIIINLNKILHCGLTCYKFFWTRTLSHSSIFGN